MNFEKLPAKASDFQNGLIDAVPVERYQRMILWFDGEGSLATGWKRTVRLFDDNRENFENIFGKPSFCWRSEFYYRCYLIRIDGAMLLMLTAKGKGTCYEIVRAYRGEKMAFDFLKIIEFLDWLWEQLPEKECESVCEG